MAELRTDELSAAEQRVCALIQRRAGDLLVELLGDCMWGPRPAGGTRPLDETGPVCWAARGDRCPGPS